MRTLCTLHRMYWIHSFSIFIPMPHITKIERYMESTSRRRVQNITRSKRQLWLEKNDSKYREHQHMKKHFIKSFISRISTDWYCECYIKLYASKKDREWVNSIERWGNSRIFNRMPDKHNSLFSLSQWLIFCPNAFHAHYSVSIESFVNYACACESTIICIDSTKHF